MPHLFSDFFCDTYGFDVGVGGLAYSGLGIGFFAATVFGAKWADKIYKYVCYPIALQASPVLIVACQLADKNGGVGKPEMRMPALFFGSFFIPVGLLCVSIWTALAYFSLLVYNTVSKKLVWLVRTSRNSLDNAHCWLWNFRFWQDILVLPFA